VEEAQNYQGANYGAISRPTPLNQLIMELSDEDMQFLYEYIEYSGNTEIMMSTYLKHRTMFAIVLIVDLFADILLTTHSYFNKEEIYQNIYEQYNGMTYKHIGIMFYSLFMFDCLVNFVYYPIGFYSGISQSIGMYKHFSNIALLSVLSNLFMSYLNMFNLLMFCIKLVAYAYSKFIVNLLISILLLPNL